MKKLFTLLCLILAWVFLPACEFLGEVFRTGLYSGIFLALLIVGAIIFTVTSLSKKK